MGMTLYDAKNALSRFIIGRRWFVSRECQDAAQVALKQLYTYEKDNQALKSQITNLQSQVRNLDVLSNKNVVDKNNLNTAIKSVKDITEKYNKLLANAKSLQAENKNLRETEERNAEYADKLHEQLETALEKAKKVDVLQAQVDKFRQERDEEYAAHSQTIEDADINLGQEQIYAANLKRELDNVGADLTIMKNTHNLELENLRKEVTRLRESEEKAKRLQEELERERAERSKLVERESELETEVSRLHEEVSKVSVQAVISEGRLNDVRADVSVVVQHLKDVLDKTYNND